MAGSKTFQHVVERFRIQLGAKSLANENEEWLFAREVLAMIANRFEYEEQAQSAILKRLECGTLQAWETGAYRFWKDIDWAECTEYTRSNVCIPTDFWKYFQSASDSWQSKPNKSEAAAIWETGDFSFRYDLKEWGAYQGYAHGVVFHRSGIADIIGERRTPNFQTGAKPNIPMQEAGHLTQQSVEALSPNSRGRPPAKWWPDFAEELAVFIHDNGPPETQEALISGIQSAMTAAGKDEPSRAQIQPVIRAVFSRLRPAGN